MERIEGQAMARARAEMEEDAGKIKLNLESLEKEIINIAEGSVECYYLEPEEYDSKKDYKVATEYIMEAVGDLNKSLVELVQETVKKMGFGIEE